MQVITRGLVKTVKKMEIEVCGWETLTDIWAANNNRFHRYAKNDGTKSPYAYAGLFADNSANCPVTAYSLHTSPDNGQTYSPYSGSDFTLNSGTGNLEVSTVNTLSTWIYVKANTQMLKFTYSPLHFVVCDATITVPASAEQLRYVNK